MSLGSSYCPCTMLQWVIRFWVIGWTQFHIDEIHPILTWVMVDIFYSTNPSWTTFTKIIQKVIRIRVKNKQFTYCKKSYNCSSIARVLNEQQNPLSVGLSLKRSEQGCGLPYQKHSRNIPNSSLSHDCITYNIPNYEEKLSMYVKEKLFLLVWELLATHFDNHSGCSWYPQLIL